MGIIPPPFAALERYSARQLHTWASWRGLAPDKVAPYEELLNAYYDLGNTAEMYQKTALDPSLAYGANSLHLKGYHAIAMSDRDDAKRAIMDNGGVDAQIYYTSSALNKNKTAYYNTETFTTNHEVELVGWNDDFDRNLFSSRSDNEKTEPTDAPTLELDRPVEIDTTAANGTWYAFTPGEDGAYKLSAEGAGAANGFAELNYFDPADKKQHLLKSVYRTSEGAPEDGRYPLLANLKAGITYYYRCGAYSSESGNAYKVTLSRNGDVDKSLYSIDAMMPTQENATEVVLEQPAPCTKNGTWFSFRPKKDGIYHIASVGNNISTNCSVRLFRPLYDGVIFNVGSAYGGDNDDPRFYYKTELKANTTYYLYCGMNDETGSAVFSPYDVTILYLGPANVLPGKNGAWLAKNSYGTGFGDNGYFWISYEEASLNLDESKAYALHLSPTDDFQHIYQYDGTGADCSGTVKSGGSIANVFEAAGNGNGAEAVSGVSFVLNDVNVNYSIQVYTELRNPADPTSGNAALASPVTGKTTYMGYYTVNLPKPARVEEGSKFSVVVTLSHENGNDVSYAVDATYNDSWARFVNAVKASQSFSRNSTDANAQWQDLANGVLYRGDTYRDCSARLKAFTVDVEAPDNRIDIASATVKMPKATYTGKALRPTPTVSVGGKTLAKDTDFSISYQNNVNAGTATAVVKGEGAYKGSKSVAFKIAKAANTMKVKTKAKSVKASKLKKRKQTLKGAIKVSKAIGNVRYAKAKSSSKRLSVNKKTGKITVKRGTPEGTYRIKVKVRAKGDANHTAKRKTVTVKVKVN